MFLGTDEIRELALWFGKKGMYPYYDEYLDLYKELNEGNKKTAIIPTYEDMSHNAREFADYWRDILLNGKKIGNIWYPGEQIFYLNFCQIEKVAAAYGDVTKSKGKGRRVKDFPDFWDEDYRYFMTCDIAKHGTTLEEYDFICQHAIDLELVRTESNLKGGLNHLYGKPRGVGASWKGAAFNAYNLYLVPNTHNFIFGASEEHIGAKDGIYAKFITLRNFIQQHAWFLRLSFSTESSSSRTFKTGFEDTIAGTKIITGFNTSVSGIVIDGEPDKGRGKRGNGTFEEFGSFPMVADTWQTFDSSLNEYETIFGQARGFGTGGDKKGTISGYRDLEKMFRDPKAYRIIEFNNYYEPQFSSRGCGMFTPSYVNISNKDSNGNSLKQQAKEVEERIREEKKLADDPTVYTNYCAEKPFVPGEMFSSSGVNIFPVELAKEVLENLVVTNVDRTECSYGRLEVTGKGLQFFIDKDKKPFEEFPIVAGQITPGCVSILYPPHRVYGKIPKDLYRIAVDPYSQAESTDSPSIGSIYVMENTNGITAHRGDLIVAWYDGRPEGYNGQSDFAEVLYKLAEYYNCKIGVENNELGEIVSYAKNSKHRDTQGNRLTNYLEEQFELNADPSLATKKKMKREYGMHMTTARKQEGIKLFQEWLLRPRQALEDGTIIRNIHTIKSRGLLREIINYNGQNADRISAMIVNMYYEKELVYNDRRAGKKRKVDSFFNSNLF